MTWCKHGSMPRPKGKGLVTLELHMHHRITLFATFNASVLQTQQPASSQDTHWSWTFKSQKQNGTAIGYTITKLHTHMECHFFVIKCGWQYINWGTGLILLLHIPFLRKSSRHHQHHQLMDHAINSVLRKDIDCWIPHTHTKVLGFANTYTTGDIRSQSVNYGTNLGYGNCGDLSFSYCMHKYTNLLPRVTDDKFGCFVPLVNVTTYP